MELKALMRTPRYSLRALLVLTTLLALVLGWEAHEVRQRRRALKLLEDNGARVEVGRDLAGHWWSRFLFGNEHFQRVRYVALAGNKLPPDGRMIAALNHLPELEHLKWSGSADDEGLLLVSSLPNLKRLELLHSRGVTNAGFARLRESTSLQSISLMNLAIDDESLVHFAAMGSLDRLHIERTSVTVAGILELQRQSPQLIIDYTKRAVAPELWP